MPITQQNPPAYRPPKESIVTWSTWKKGLNLLLRENEVAPSEMTLATNLLLKGSGIPTKRWGSRDYFTAGATGGVEFIHYAKKINNDIEILALTDWGILTKKSGASYVNISGYSWPSGSVMDAAQLGEKVYLVSSGRPWVRYNFSTLVSFPTVSLPSNVLVTNMSGATGAYEWSWRISTLDRAGGETLSTTPVSLASLPQDLTNTVMRISWTGASAASGDIVGYNIYRGTRGNEKWIANVDHTTLRYDDAGLPPPDVTKVVPSADTTGGVNAKYILRYQDRLILAGIPNDPTLLMVSGRFPYQERFDMSAGGGYIPIEPDSGENITGLGMHQEKLIVFKERSVWQVNLGSIETQYLTILDIQYKLLTASQGCKSHKTIVPVENDLMFANDRGVYILRYEPQLQNIINASEISAKIRPFFEGLTEADINGMSAAYIDKKYVLSFPISKQTVIFDRERMCFMGPWRTPFGINKWIKYTDSDGIERWLAADSTDNIVSEFKASYPDDKNTAIPTIFKSRKEDFNDWTLYKTINEVYLNFGNAIGEISVSIYLEDRSGNIINTKSFIFSGSGTTGTTGMGTDAIGDIQLGDSNMNAIIAMNEIPKKAYIYKSTRTIQVEIRTTEKTSNYELLGAKIIAIAQSRGNNPSSWVV